MRVVADLHIHSKYSRAVSKFMVPEVIAQWAKYKGLDVVGTGDCTHPAWVSELKEKLEEAEPGLYYLKGDKNSPRFLISGEVACIYKQGGRGRRVHVIFFVPNWQVLDKINAELGKRGNLLSDGRPILGISAKELAQIIFAASEDCLVIPAHAWTPWFGVLGSKSGFDSIEECFEELTPKIFAIETGLSSDPPMNWRVSDLDGFTLLSHSDAHSPKNMMREADVFDLPELSYQQVTKAIKEKNPKQFLYTIEFYPEEGMYHWDGNRHKGICLPPEETQRLSVQDSSLAKTLTIGVEHRVLDLADRPSFVDESTKVANGKSVMAGKPVKPPKWGIPYVNLVPLAQIIAEVIGVKVGAKSVEKEYFNIVRACGSEFAALMDKNYDELVDCAGKRVAEGIMRVREGKISVKPGYDGVYGEVKVFGDDMKEEDKGSIIRQRKLF